MAAPLHGQVAITGTAQQLSASANPSSYTIKAPVGNANSVFLGSSTVTTGNGYKLDPGETVDLEKRAANGWVRYETSISELWVVGTTGDIVCWLGFP